MVSLKLIIALYFNLPSELVKEKKEENAKKPCS